MNSDFFKKIKTMFQSAPKLPSKPFAETGFRPMLLWKILLVVYLFLIIFFTLFTIFSYNFLTKNREGFIDPSLAITPKINASKIEKVNTFFANRAGLVEAVYKKTIIDPGTN